MFPEAVGIEGDVEALSAVLQAGQAAGGSPEGIKAATAARFGTSTTVR